MIGRDGLQEIADELWRDGLSVRSDFISPADTAALAAECRQAWEAGDFRQAGVGFRDSLRVDESVRRDHVRWLGDGFDGAHAAYLRRLEALRLTLNQELMLGLFSFEGHLTVYPPGAFYRKHLDQFRGVAHRIVSCILYLNEDWRGDDGGELRIYLDGTSEERFVDIEPRGGTLVTFLSDRFYHEVLPAGRERMSLTGWFRRRDV